MKQKAFTLLELLVVITIIGILASIVVGSMSGSTDSATIAKGKAYAQQVHALLGHEAILDLSFNENAYNTCSDGKDVCDASGYGNNGEISGAAFVASQIDGHALSFDGLNDYVTISDNPLWDFGTDDFSINFWFKTSGTERAHALNFGGVSSNNLCFNFNNSPYGVWVYWMGGGSPAVRTTSFYNDGNWHNLFFTRSGNLFKLFLDGVFVHSTTNSSSIQVNSFSIGSAYATVYFWNGLIDDVRVYAEAIPSTEIQKQYAQGLKKLLANQAITQEEYGQRMKGLN